MSTKAGQLHLTNTYFEGEVRSQPKALRGHSKDKRTDCPLLTLGLVLDASGFVRRSQVFAGNVREHYTLAQMLEALKAPRAAVVVMDRGIATEDRLRWLREQGYLRSSAERGRRPDRRPRPAPPCDGPLDSVLPPSRRDPDSSVRFLNIRPVRRREVGRMTRAFVPTEPKGIRECLNNLCFGGYPSRLARA